MIMTQFHRCCTIRRVVLAAAFSTLGAIALSLQAGGQSATQGKPSDQKELACNVPDGFSVAAVGDVLTPQPFSMTADPQFQHAADILRNADIGFGNFEGNIIDIRYFKGYPAGSLDDVDITGAPDLAKSLKSMGFKIMSHANNHSTDWGIEGMLVTDRALDEAGIVHAGTGENRAAARAARYLNTPKGRVGLVSLASTVGPNSMALAPVGEAPGRPGVDALRTTRYVLVTAEMMRDLRKIRDAQPKGSTEDFGEKNNPNELTMFGTHYRVGEHTGLTFEMNPVDLHEVLMAIRQGKLNSDFVIATIHAHDPGNWSELPADFLPILAHDAIDAGADMFIGHGPHRLRGIEIYKGKPIFYSLANFIYQDQLQQPMTESLYEDLKLDPRQSTDADLGMEFVEHDFPDVVYYQSVIAVSEFRQGQVSEIKLYPLDLGFTSRFADKGVPRLASPEVARTILERLQRLSQPYGTTISIEQNVGVIRTSNGS
jgi:poly-gamma-glutamate synthesis protein (capsule biosynthesis protein)